MALFPLLSSVEKKKSGLEVNLEVFSARILTGYLASLLSDISGLSSAGGDWEVLVNTDGTLN